MTDTLIVRSPEEPSRPEYQGQAVATAQTQPSPATGAGWPVEARFAAWVIMSAGAIFRICKWVHWRSLWLDELYI
ncbi:MAG TPA: hypothetical protein VMD30_08285, partial [Tepidisphaeraceae bacterium]|nr:hypothetical protein [Tepidisphaeraceae bacterium]